MPAPTPKRLFFSFLALSLLLFLRPPNTGYVFDEQEAILANPYLLGDVPFSRAFHVDFWGLPPARTIGSYRPLPNLLWRTLAFSLDFHTPWALGFFNLFSHALSSTLLARIVALFVRSLPPREAQAIVWFSGLSFCVCALSSEAVCSLVGLADLLVGLFSLASIWLIVSLAPISSYRELFSLNMLRRSVGLFLCILLGLLSKETMVVSLCLLPLVYWLRPAQFLSRPSFRISGAALAVCAGGAALLSYLSLRNAFFPALPSEDHPLIISGPGATLLRTFFTWFAPPTLPEDPMNNPLILASSTQRILSAAAIYLEQSALFLAPLHLSADYSFPRQVPSGPGLRAGAGLLLFFASLLVCSWGTLQSLAGKKLSPAQRLLSLGAGWCALSFLPVSNALLLLPTIRADRLFYSPTIGACLALASLGPRLRALTPNSRSGLALSFLVLQGVQARAHALHYSNDVAFWRATSAGAPASAKAYLNYGVMVGARGDLERRIRYTERSVMLAPQWPMARIYLADAHCRHQNMAQAMPLYLQALSEVPNSKALTALSLQCIWEHGAFQKHKHELQDLAADHSDSWLDYFVYELSQQEASGKGIEKKYRPRAYNARRSQKK